MTPLFLGNGYTYPKPTSHSRSYTLKGQFRGLKFEIKTVPVQAICFSPFIYRGVSC